jgi:hypothetical protein
MSDHQTSYTINSMIGRLYLKNKAFQSLNLYEQQSIVLDLLQESYHSDVNIGEMLSNECFSDYKDINEMRTIATIFQICSYCRQPKEGVKDFGSYGVQGFCSDCAKQFFPD